MGHLVIWLRIPIVCLADFKIFFVFGQFDYMPQCDSLWMHPTESLIGLLDLYPVSNVGCFRPSFLLIMSLPPFSPSLLCRGLTARVLAPLTGGCRYSKWCLVFLIFFPFGYQMSCLNVLWLCLLPAHISFLIPLVNCPFRLLHCFTRGFLVNFLFSFLCFCWSPFFVHVLFCWLSPCSFGSLSMFKTVLEFCLVTLPSGLAQEWFLWVSFFLRAGRAFLFLWVPCDAFVENGRGQGTGAGGSADHLQIFPSVPLKFSSRVGVLPKPLFILFYLTFKKHLSWEIIHISGLPWRSSG